MASQMQADKDSFVSKHKIKKSQSEAIEKAQMNKDGIVQIPRKRPGEADNADDDDELTTLEKKVRSKKGDKQFSNKRQRTN